jgi:hypothetical protein
MEISTKNIESPPSKMEINGN